MRIVDGAHYEYHQSDSLVLTGVFVSIGAVEAFLLDMLVAQVTCTGEAVYSGVIGYASLDRIEVIVGCIPVASVAILLAIKHDQKDSAGNHKDLLYCSTCTARDNNEDI